MLLEHLMSVAQPLGWSCREVMQFPRSLSPGISGVKTSRLFLGDIPARTKCVITLWLIFYYSIRGEPWLTSIIQFYTVISDLLCEGGSCWSHFPGEECRPTWTPMCRHLQNQNRMRNFFNLGTVMFLSHQHLVNRMSVIMANRNLKLRTFSIHQSVMKYIVFLLIKD